MAQKKYTRTPWAIAKAYDDSDFAIKSGSYEIGVWSKYSEEDVANAAFIVKAVNCHEKLLELAAEGLWRKDYPQGGSVYKTYDSLNSADKEIYRKAALAAAEASHA